MALTDESSGIPATMLVGPASVGNAAPYPYPVFGGMGGGGNQGFGNDGGWWIVLLIIVIAALGGNWGGNGNGGGFGGGQPIIVNDGGGSVQRGFDQAATMAGLSGIQSGIYGLSTQLCGCCGDIQNSLCSGFAGVNATVNNGVNTIAQQLYTGTIADLERSFAAQAASTQGMNAIQSSLAQCCCDNRLATNDLRYTIATEACNDRAALSQGIQTVLDKLCQLELDGYKRENDSLRSQLSAANLAASQIDQTARILAGQTSEVDALYNRLSNCPVPTVPVYGRQPIFTCPNPQNNCGCGCGNASF